MKRVISIFGTMLFVALSMRATCGPSKPAAMRPVEAVKLSDNVYFHNVSITHDGKHYFTINGGNDSYCTLNMYDDQGQLVDAYDVGLDARSLFFNSRDGRLYVKVYGLDLYVIDLDNESADIVLSDVFDVDNSSVGISEDGKRIYELIEGHIRVLDFKTGKELKRFKLTNYFDQHGYNSSIAVSSKYLFVWGDSDAIIVYDMNGDYVSEFRLPRPGYGFSLSYCNKMLWIAQDADASTDGGNGYWYGYRL
jgi:WD40 repeat protein